jgi:maltooligosyltrehalose trehalohydrolase
MLFMTAFVEQRTKARRPSATECVVQKRCLPIGAEILPGGGVHFRVWAPDHKRVAVAIENLPGGGATLDLDSEGDGYFSATVVEAGCGTRYCFRLDADTTLNPDPASRFQPEGPYGPSQVIDPCAFDWTDQGWQGIGRHGHVLYELHVGTFTLEGTWKAATRELPELAALGVTVIELMPIADFVGRFGWGYDGVSLFAPYRLYGTPDDLRHFVDRAHALGIGVILDVVYNHLGPDGNYLKQFAAAYFTDRYKNEWGEALNFDGSESGPVREFFVANAGYWIEEYHLDGLRLDATQQIFDSSSEHILAAITQRVRLAATGREAFIVAENEPQHIKLVRPCENGGYDIDALWNDDFHHSATVALTGHNEAYYSDHLGSPQEFISAAKRGYLYQGQRYSWQKRARGTPALDQEPARFISFLQNHDQVANSGRGLRIHALSSPGRCRAMTALLLLGPATPMLFQGQEFAASAPFCYFADHKPELAELVAQGRKDFLRQFPSLAIDAMQEQLMDPSDLETFERCKLDFGERVRHAEVYALHRDLLALRRADPVFRLPRFGGVDGAVLSNEAFVLRFFGGSDHDRLLVVNLGRDLRLVPAPEPLLAPPEASKWQVVWSSEDPRYGGCGWSEPEDEQGWHIPGHAALALKPRPMTAS